MNKTVCPGQDTRFWRPGDIFEVTCGACGATIEFFKDETHRRCRKCGNRVQNPKLSMGCAQWCEHAKECLGFDPKDMKAEDGFEASLVDKLIEAMKKEFGSDQKRITHALMVLEKAQEILRKERGDPRVTLAAALLHDIGIREAERKYGSSAGKYQEIEGPPIAKGIMKEVGLEDDTIERVNEIIANHHSARGVDTPEFRIIWDADNIVNLADEEEKDGRGRIGEIIEKTLKTKTGKKMALEMFLKEEG